MSLEPVLELHDFYDGPREGIAHFNGIPHHFKSRHIDSVEYKGDFESADIFVLTSTSETCHSESFLALAAFVPASPDVAPGGYQVAWQVVDGVDA